MNNQILGIISFLLGSFYIVFSWRIEAKRRRGGRGLSIRFGEPNTFQKVLNIISGVILISIGYIFLFVLVETV